MIVTFFADFTARTKRERDYTLPELAELIRVTTAREKARLPWLKCARFGEIRSDSDSLRHDVNVSEISGLEADYDGEQIGFYRAEEIAKSAGLDCILYTSARHRPARPRWRILAPLSRPYPPPERAPFLDWLHGLYSRETGGGGVFAAESWRLSQAYFFGQVIGAAHYRVVLVEGRPIDQLEHLASGARGTPIRGEHNGGDPGGGADARGDAELIRRVATADGYHVELCALAGRYIGRGMDQRAATETLRGLMLAQADEDRDERWHDRYASIPALVASAGRKYTPQHEHRRAIARLVHGLIRSGRSGSEIKTAVLAEAQRRQFAPEPALDIARRIVAEKTKGTDVG